MKSRLSSFIKNKMPRTLRGNFLLITISLMLVFGMGASVMSYIMFSDNLRANSLHSSETNLQFMCNEIDTNLNSVYDLAFWSQTNTAISSYISTSPDDNYYSALTKNASERLTEEYLGTAAYQYIPQIIITNADGTKYLQKYSSASYSTDRGVISTIKSLPYYEDLMNAADYTFSVGVQNNPFSRTFVQPGQLRLDRNSRSAGRRSVFCLSRSPFPCLQTPFPDSPYRRSCPYI